MDKIVIKELIHIRCLLEDIYLDSTEAKNGCTLESVERRVKGELDKLKE